MNKFQMENEMPSRWERSATPKAGKSKRLQYSIHPYGRSENHRKKQRAKNRNFRK